MQCFSCAVNVFSINSESCLASAFSMGIWLLYPQQKHTRLYGPLPSLQNQTLSTLRHLWFHKQQQQHPKSPRQRPGRKTKCVCKKIPVLKMYSKKSCIYRNPIKKLSLTNKTSLAPGDSIKLQLLDLSSVWFTVRLFQGIGEPGGLLL